VQDGFKSGHNAKQARRTKQEAPRAVARRSTRLGAAS